ncbi:MAG: glycosyltransferase family 4 protein [Muribaculaceae bacterium]|nr:glycosyltransferase family 4 protein [Muribaculaceae bacterium]
MKILVVSNMYPSAKDPVYGTFVRNFVEQTRALNPEATVDVVTICGRRKGYAAKAVAYARFYCRLTATLLFRDYDLIYVHTITFPIIPIRVAKLFRRDLPLVFNVHGDDVLPSNSLKRALKAIARPVVRKARMIVCPSSYFAKVVRREIGRVDPDRLFVSPSGGVDTRFFVDRARPVKSEQLILGFVSRIESQKGWETFIEALSAVRARGIDCRAIIAGGGKQVEQMKQLIATKHLEEYIDYRGPVAQSDLPLLYSSVDLFVFPTRARESLGLVGLEAMAAGTPVAASDMAGPKTYVVDGVNGYLFEPGNVDALVDKILIFNRRSPDTRARLSAEARATAAQYESSLVASRLNAALLPLLSQS